MGNASSLKHHVDTAEKTGVIRLSKSNLRDVPKELQKISHLLRTLDLSNNRIQQIGDDLSDFRCLKILNLSQNRLKSIPSSIGNLSRLESVLLAQNSLDSLPAEMALLSNLKTVNLSSNKFNSFPIQLCQLKSLEALDLSQNEIEALPDEIGQCTASEINLNNNRITRLTDALTLCTDLKILRLDSNKLELASLTKSILTNSKICLLSVENNLFSQKQLQDRDGYDSYMDRYTSTKRKMI